MRSQWNAAWLLAVTAGVACGGDSAPPKALGTGSETDGGNVSDAAQPGPVTSDPDSGSGPVDRPKLDAPKPAPTYEVCEPLNPKKVYAIAKCAGDDGFHALFALDQSEAICVFGCVPGTSCRPTPSLIEPQTGKPLTRARLNAWAEALPDAPMWTGSKWIIGVRKDELVIPCGALTTHAFLRSNGSFGCHEREVFYDGLGNYLGEENRVSFTNGDTPPPLPTELRDTAAEDAEGNLFVGLASKMATIIWKDGSSHPVDSPCEYSANHVVLAASPRGFLRRCGGRFESIQPDGSVTVTLEAPAQLPEGASFMNDGAAYRISADGGQIERCSPDCTVVWDRLEQPLYLLRDMKQPFVGAGDCTVTDLISGL